MGLPRFSFIQLTPYANHIARNRAVIDAWAIPDTINGLQEATLLGSYANAEATIASGRMVSQSTLVSGQMVSESVQASARSTISAMGESTQQLSGELKSLQLSQLFGSLLQVGATAASTYFITKELKETKSGIERLGSLFSEGMTLLASQLDIHTKEINKIKDRLDLIHETLKSPTVTKATEWRNIGLERFSQGLFPEANRAFSQAVKLNETDPLCYLMLGKIFLDGIDQEINLQNYQLADLCFNRAEKYSKAALKKAPELLPIVKEALYLKSFLCFVNASQQRINGEEKLKYSQTMINALKPLEELLKLDNRYEQALYLKSKIYLLFGKYQEAKEIFNELLKIDISFLATAYNDKDFADTQMGQKMLAEAKQFFISQLEPEITRFFRVLDECKIWNIELPENLLIWKNKLGWMTVDDAKRQLYQQTDSLIKSEMTIGTVIKFANKELTSLVIDKQDKCKIELEELVNRTSSIRSLQTIYIDESWYKNHSVLTRSSIIKNWDGKVKDLTSFSDYANQKTMFELAESESKLLDHKISIVINALERAREMHSKFKVKSMAYKSAAILIGGLTGTVIFIISIPIFYDILGSESDTIGSVLLLALSLGLVGGIYSGRSFITYKYRSSEAVIFLLHSLKELSMSEERIQYYIENLDAAYS